MTKLVTLLLSMVLLLSTNLTVYAGDTSQLSIVDKSNASEEVLKKINTGIKNVPDYILEYHNKIGGTVRFTKSTLPGYGDDIVGMYYYSGENRYNIVLRTDNSFYEKAGSNIESYLPHELGHFVWDVGFKESASESDWELLNEQYEYWKDYRFDCKSIEETFASLYVTHINYPANLSEEVNNMFNSCEERIEALEKAS